MNRISLDQALPESIRELALLIGFTEAMIMVQHFGGIALPVPKGSAALGALRYESILELIGKDATDKLVARWGGDRLYIPRCHRQLIVSRWIAIVSEFTAGATAQQLAIKYRLTERAIWKILKKPVDIDVGQPEQQSTLF